jgi:molybdopterin-binding protein
VTAIIKVALNGGGQVVTSSITCDAVEDLGLAEGTAVTVLVKASEVMLAVE